MTSIGDTPPVYWLLGLPFDVIDTEQTAELLFFRARHKTRTIFATPNLNFLRTRSEDPDFLNHVLHTDLSLVDGMPLYWLGKLLGVPLPERVAGSTLVDHLATRPTDALHRLRTYVFGAEGDAARIAMERLNAAESSLRGVGAANPGVGSVEELSTPAIIQEINASEADFLVVSLGAIKGHAWIEHNRDRLNPPIISHLGAAVNFMAGTVRRAPRLIQQLGLEWAWRVVQEPRLLGRYLGDGMFLFRLVFGAVLPLLVEAAQRPSSELEVRRYAPSRNSVALRPRGVIDDATVDILAEAVARQDPSDIDNVEIQMQEIQYVDSRGLGFLYTLLHRGDGRIRYRITGSNARLARLVRWHNAECLWS